MYHHFSSSTKAGSTYNMPLTISKAFDASTQEKGIRKYQEENTATHECKLAVFADPVSIALVLFLDTCTSAIVSSK